MNKLTNTGRWMFALTFIMGGTLHLTGPQFTAPQVPAFFGAPYFWAIFTGVAQLAFAVSILIKKYDKLAAVCLCAMMLVFIVSMHIPKAIAGDFMGVISVMRDFGYAGAAILYAGAVAQDNRIVG
jgi:putative oxidoreductase